MLPERNPNEPRRSQRDPQQHQQVKSRHARPLLGGGPLALVPIPLHPQRLAARGFNQSALLAHDVGARLGVPVWENFLERRRSTPPLAECPTRSFE